MTQQSTYHRGSQNYGTGYEMMARIDELEATLSALSKRHEKALALGADNRDKLAKAVEALVECRYEIDTYVQNEYPLDHPVQERCRQRDYAANPARMALVELTNEKETS